MKPLSIVVTGEPTNIKALINSISYGPDEAFKHQYQSIDQQATTITMNFGSLQVDEDHRIDFYGGNEPQLFEFIDTLPNPSMKAVIITIDAGQAASKESLKQSFAEHLKYLKKYALAIGISGANYQEIKQTEDLVRTALIELNSVAPVFSIKTEHKEDVSLLVESLLCFLDPGIQESI